MKVRPAPTPFPPGVDVLLNQDGLHLVSSCSPFLQNQTALQIQSLNLSFVIYICSELAQANENRSRGINALTSTQHDALQSAQAYELKEAEHVSALKFAEETLDRQQTVRYLWCC